MSVTLNGRSYTNASFTGYGYLGIFPEQFAEDLLAQAAIIAPDATTVSAKAAYRVRGRSRQQRHRIRQQRGRSRQLHRRRERRRQRRHPRRLRSLADAGGEPGTGCQNRYVNGAAWCSHRRFNDICSIGINGICRQEQAGGGCRRDRHHRDLYWRLAEGDQLPDEGKSSHQPNGGLPVSRAGLLHPHAEFLRGLPYPVSLHSRHREGDDRQCGTGRRGGNTKCCGCKAANF